MRSPEVILSRAPAPQAGLSSAARVGGSSVLGWGGQVCPFNLVIGMLLKV